MTNERAKLLTLRLSVLNGMVKGMQSELELLRKNCDHDYERDPAWDGADSKRVCTICGHYLISWSH